MTHPEEEAAVKWVRGRTVEVGCGSNPTPGVEVTVDHTPGGQAGVAGCETGQTSVAQLTGDMASLPFDDKDFDTLLARHVLEHHSDTLTVLQEWVRVADRLVIVCPDQATYPGSTVALDPTHVAAFTPMQLAHLASHVGLHPVRIEPVIPQWSFILVAEVHDGR